ncbi:MAG: rhodanese-like domain-containing protein [Solirubrobacteraceae bacterium]
MIGRPDAAILDVRSQAEFAGERFWPSGATEDAGRAGHIPGATHVPFELIRDDEQALKPPDELRALFEAHGFGPERPIVTYCTIGNRGAKSGSRSSTCSATPT